MGLSRWLEKRHRRWSTFIGSTFRALPRPTQPTLCLFCDFEGPHAGPLAGVHMEQGTERLLRLLESKGLRITFNVVADLCRTHVDLVRRLTAAGHELACHGWRHERPRDLDDRDRDRMLVNAGEAFDALSIRPAGFRSPESAWCVGLLDQLSARGYSWNAERDFAGGMYQIRNGLVRVPVRTDDWDLTNPEAGIAELLRKWEAAVQEATTPHGFAALGVHEWIFGTRPDLAESLQCWLSARANEGWRIVPISEAVKDVAQRGTDIV